MGTLAWTLVGIVILGMVFVMGYGAYQWHLARNEQSPRLRQLRDEKTHEVYDQAEAARAAEHRRD